MWCEIAKFNKLEETECLEIINCLFEETRILSHELINTRPFASFEDLISKAEQFIQQLSEDDKVLVVNAHPRIGAPLVTLSTQSKKEQGRPEEGLQEILKELEILNQEYESKNGFKFIVFVNGRTRGEILKVLKTRLLNPRDEELKTGLGDMILIAKDRLRKLQSSPSQ